MSTMENLRASCSWVAERMLTTNPLARVSASCTEAVFSMQIRTSGGSSDSEQNALTVMPWSAPLASLVVTTVTPDGNRPSTARNSSEVTGGGGGGGGGIKS